MHLKTFKCDFCEEIVNVAPGQTKESLLLGWGRLEIRLFDVGKKTIDLCPICIAKFQSAINQKNDSKSEKHIRENITKKSGITFNTRNVSIAIKEVMRLLIALGCPKTSRILEKLIKSGPEQYASGIKDHDEHIAKCIMIPTQQDENLALRDAARTISSLLDDNKFTKTAEAIRIRWKL